MYRTSYRETGVITVLDESHSSTYGQTTYDTEVQPTREESEGEKKIGGIMRGHHRPRLV